MRQAICNEIFQGWAFADACRTMRQIGYEGIEIAPFTMAEAPAAISAADRRQYRTVIADEGLAFVGLHWLMVSPKGLHVTTPDDALRTRSWQHIHELIDLCADLGPNGVMVFGSPHQRSTTGGATRAEATARFADGLAAAAPHAVDRGVTLLIEALPSAQSDIVNTLAEAVALVEAIGSPAIKTMFDSHNTADEIVVPAELIRQYAPQIRHVHVNEMDGRHCGTGDYDFAGLFRAMEKVGYNRWISLEAFDFTPGAERIARESLQHLTAALHSE